MNSELKHGLLAAYKQLLTPLVRILLRNGVSANEFAEVSRVVFIDVATSVLSEKKQEQTHPAIASITGLTTEEIRRTEATKDSRLTGAGTLERITKILTGWHTDTRYTGPYGLPLELPFADSRNPDICGLLARYCPDEDPRKVALELCQIGVVKETDNNWFKVLTRVYLPKVDAPDSLSHLGKAVSDFVETIDHNRQVTNADDRLVERIVDADNGIHPQDLPRFKAYVKERAQLLLEEIDNWLSQLDPPGRDENAQMLRTGVGIYHFVDTKLARNSQEIEHE